MAIGNQEVLNKGLKERNLEDIQGGQSVVIYLYTIENFKNRGFIKEQALSVLQIKALDAPTCIRTSGQIDISQSNVSNNTKGSSVKIQPRATQYGYSTTRDFASLNKNNRLIIATLEPLNIGNDGKPNTEVFIMQQRISQFLKPIQMQEEKLYNPTDFMLLSMDDIVGNYQNLILVYTFLDTYKQINEINLTMQNYSYFNKIMARGLTEDSNIDTDIKLKINSVDTKFSLLNLSPTSTNYKVSWYSHWLDANRTLAYVKAKLFIGQKGGLKKLIFNDKNGDFKPWGTTQIEDAYAVVFNMIKMTQAFATGFKDYRIDDKGKPSPSGKIDPTLEIGGISLADVEGKPAIITVDGILETFIQKHPSSIHDSGFKIMMEVMTMLGRYINTTHLIGKGINRYNEVFLPWTFTLITSIDKNTDPKSDDINVLLSSKYFDINQKTSKHSLVVLSQFLELSNYNVFDIGGWISEAELPNIIKPLNSFANIGDVPTTNDAPIKYLFLVPYRNQLSLENLYGSLHVDKKTGWHPEAGTKYFKQNRFTSWEQNQTPSKPPQPTGIDFASLINLAGNERIHAGSIKNRKNNDLIIQEKTVTTTKIVGGYPKYIHTKYWRYSYFISCDYEIDVNGDQTITTTQHRGQIFDKGDLQSISNNLMEGADKYTLSLLPIHTIGNQETKNVITKLNEINIQGINLDKIGINISFTDNKGKVIQLYLEDILLPSHYDEVLTNLTILL